MRIYNTKQFKTNQYQQDFHGNTIENANSSTTNNLQDKNNDYKLTFSKKLQLYPLLARMPLFLPITYGSYHLIKAHYIKKKVKTNILSEDKLKEFKRSSVKKFLFCCGLIVPMYFLANYINKKSENKNFAKAQTQIDIFNEHNGTNIKLVKIPNTSQEMIKKSASFNPIPAQINLSEFIPGDIINANLLQTHIINHELIHAKQNILMACSENGINKLNYITIYKMTKALDDEKIKLISTAYQDLKNDNFTDDGTEITIPGGYKINYNSFVISMYKAIYEKDTNPDNYPTVINKTFFEQAKKSKGPLTTDEEQKAQKYFDAEMQYVVFNPNYSTLAKENSDYRENLLEQEADDAPFKKYVI